MTGRYAIRTGFQNILPPYTELYDGESTLADELRAVGYHTGEARLLLDSHCLSNLA